MRTEKKICLIMNDNTYVGREYASALQRKNIFVDIALIGNNDTFDKHEDERCGGLWTPVSQDDLSINFSIRKFKSLNDKLFIEHLYNTSYSLGIQGGIGILKNIHINKFSEGIINFHPGDVPFYRGCSAPEYQYSDGKPVISSCHFIAEGIDNGDVIEKQKLNVDMQSYFSFRASIYPLTSQFMVEIVSRWLAGGELKRYHQNENVAVYNKYIGDDAIDRLIKNWGMKKL
jgi:methionyl-tRNA formyltransferase